MSVMLANAERRALEAAAAVLSPPPALDLVAWAETNVEFGSESQFEGRYSFDLFPFFRDVMRALQPDDPCNVVALKKSAQIGGTVLGQVFVLGAIELDPCWILVTQPVDNNAVRYANSKLRPMAARIRSLRQALPLDAKRERGASTHYIERRDGQGGIFIEGANSAAGLSQISVKRQVQDDLSKWENNNNGDPETQADSRSMALFDHKIFKNSTPTKKRECRISAVYDRGTRERWHMPCPHCGVRRPFEWENLKANLRRRPDGTGDPASVHFTCHDCGGVIEQRHRREMVARGSWVAEVPAAKVRSFHLWTAYSPLVSWEKIAEAWWAAEGVPAKEEAFLNDWSGEAWDAPGQAPPAETLRERAERDGHRRGRVPPGYGFVTIGVDCQQDRLEWQAVAWGPMGRRAVVDYDVIPHPIADERGRAALRQLMETPFPADAGAPRKAMMLAIDAGFDTATVLDWVGRQDPLRTMAVRGSRFDKHPVLSLGRPEHVRFSGKPVRRGARTWFVGVSRMKFALYANLVKEDPVDRCFVAIPRGMPVEFFRGLTSERRMAKKDRSGFTVHVWEQVEERNEPLDTMLYAEAAAVRLSQAMTDADWDALVARLEAPPLAPDLFDAAVARPAETASAPEPAPAPAAAPAAGGERRSSGWMGERGKGWW
ncbi:MAG: phage terminase large subunit family protein [Phenylobacterium sp.]|nr:phage terminase large subunit family protein [Phenylobacterium sp.]